VRLLKLRSRLVKAGRTRADGTSDEGHSDGRDGGQSHTQVRSTRDDDLNNAEAWSAQLAERVGGGEGEPLAGISKVAVFVSVVKRSGPHIIEASLIPTALFYSCLVMAGLGAAYAVALVWLYSSVVRRLVRRDPIPPLLIMGVIGITVRTTVAVASGSSFFYFAQPVASSAVMGCVFLVSVFVGRPMVEKLALEFWPLTPEMMANPAVTRLLRGLTFLWAGINLFIGATNLTLLLALPLAAFVAVKQIASLAITGTGIAVTIDASVRTARREGYIAPRAGRRLRLLPVTA
jgi:hypothetical protein